MRPIKTLLFILSVFLLLAVAMWVTPPDGVKIGSFTFHMPAFTEMRPGNSADYADVSKIIKNQFDIDSLTELIDDSVSTETTVQKEIKKASYDSLIQSILKIEITPAGRQNLNRFFRKLKTDSLVHILHYGDSQIEGDRITSFIRNKLQVRFGGSGPGLRPALQPYDYVFSAKQENTGNWQRFPGYGKVDERVEHNRYGVMGAFSRFAPPVSGTLPFADSILYRAGLTISKNDISYKRTRKYKYLRLFYGNAKQPVTVSIANKSGILKTDTLKANLDYGVIKCNLPDTTDFIALQFTGYDSPDIYGIELAAPKGVIVDNIALRGSSGTIFTKMNFEHSKKMFDDLQPALFILQFGGNVMPYIKDEKAIENYGRWFTGQIKRLQLLCPDAAILVIGPSDMATKEKDRYVTYKYLPMVVETLKEAALSNGCGFWNMYEAMGGHNSMPSWVNAEPSLARPDYVHFSPRGARLVANLFYNALILEYNNFITETK